MRTKAFKSGNSQAVRIPAGIAYADTDAELEITRTGDVITIYPAPKRGLKETLDVLAKMPPRQPLGPIERTQVRLTAWDKEVASAEDLRELAEEQRQFGQPSEAGNPKEKPDREDG